MTTTAGWNSPLLPSAGPLIADSVNSIPGPWSPSRQGAATNIAAPVIGRVSVLLFFSELPEISYQRLALFGLWGTVEVDAISRGNRRNDARGLHRLYLFKELDIVIDDVFQCRSTVVVEVRSGLSDAM